MVVGRRSGVNPNGAWSYVKLEVEVYHLISRVIADTQDGQTLPDFFPMLRRSPAFRGGFLLLGGRNF